MFLISAIRGGRVGSLVSGCHKVRNQRQRSDRLSPSLRRRAQVLMKDITTPVPTEDMRNLVRKYLEKAARINYGQLLEYAGVKGERRAVHALRSRRGF